MPDAELPVRRTDRHFRARQLGELGASVARPARLCCMGKDDDRQRPLLTPELGYLDARAAIEWLTDILGLRVGGVSDREDGAVAHAELWWQGFAVYVGTVGSDQERGRSTVCLVADNDGEVDRLYGRALNANCEVVFPLTDTAFGSHQFAVHDPEGHVWVIGTYRPTPP